MRAQRTSLPARGMGLHVPTQVTLNAELPLLISPQELGLVAGMWVVTRGAAQIPAGPGILGWSGIRMGVGVRDLAMTTQAKVPLLVDQKACVLASVGVVTGLAVLLRMLDRLLEHGSVMATLARLGQIVANQQGLGLAGMRRMAVETLLSVQDRRMRHGLGRILSVLGMTLRAERGPFGDPSPRRVVARGTCLVLVWLVAEGE